MESHSFIALAQNASLLLAAALLFDITAARWKVGHQSPRQIAAGIILGAICLVLMSTPWTLMPGVVFDTRSILLGVSGLFFGTLSTIIAMAMASVYRLFQGGAGAWTGVSVILATGGIGLLWRHTLRKKLAAMSWRELFLFGLAIHVAMLALMLTLPAEIALFVLKRITLPVLLIYPLGTALVGRLMVNRLKRELHEKDIRENEEKYRKLFSAVQDPVLVADRETGLIVECNPAAELFFGRSRKELIGLHHSTFHEAALLDTDGFLPEFKQMADGPCSIERISVIAANNEKRLASVQGAQFSLGDHDYFLGIFRDITEQMEAAEALRESQQRLSLAVEGTGLGLWDWQIQTGELYVNEQWAAIVGYTLDSLLPVTVEKWMRLCHPDDLTHTKMLVEEHFKGQTERYECEMRMLHKNGHWVWVLDQGKVFERDQAGLPLRMSGTHQDITPRRQAEQALLESESLYRSLFMESQVIMLLVDPEKCEVVEGNNTAIQYYGWSKEELRGKKLTEINTLPQEALTKEITAAREKEKGFFSFQHRLSSGEIRDVEVYSGPVAIQGKQMLYSCIFDITSRKKAEERLRLSEEFQKSMIECSPVALYSVDLQGRVQLWNTSAQTIFGWSAEEVLHKPLPIVAKDHQEEFLHIRNRVMRGETIVGLELVRRRKDGSSVDISLSTTRVLDAHGHVMGVMGAAQDITQRKHEQEELLKAKEAAEAANAAKTEFLANMSHELRTPLNGVMGMLQLIGTTPLNSEQHECVEMATLSCTRLTRLLSDILDMSRIESGKMEIRNEVFELADILRAVEQIFRPATNQTGIALQFIADPQIPSRLRGDPARLHQILNNLVGNALKFTTSGSVVAAVHALPSYRQGQLRLLFSITDTGIGIPDSSLDSLFEPFTQVEGSYTRHFQGAGLGLSIVKRLVQLMDGAMCVESTLGVGSSFHVCLQFGIEAEQSLATQQIPKPYVASSRPRTILLAEDDHVSAHVVVKLMEKIGCTVHTVEDGKQALEALRRKAFDIVLMDVQMPVMDGVEATRRIRDGEAGKENADIAIIALTAYAMAGDRETFLTAGMDGYLEKPVVLETLQKMMATLAPGTSS